ncbi:alkene reductase [Rudanella paleaurantiibacter]|uniref:Alkene reductase n=1 Tax=Rudanella paleaurantiibacter TaxID=2614655 RepID=A0A7J5TS67_9BACT|nr:alkene reductase [Rudanella paleaurantiibacter]KAB7726118.1 alkene reductase [Rudanella paleaurantiibacter]
MANKLFAPAQLGGLTLSNPIVMAPMTRNRATAGHDVTDIMATYYEQRASAGLLITEGVAPSPNGNGYARVPGLYTPEQVAGWKAVTAAVHAKGGRIFAQLMHTGRVGHPVNMHAGGQVLAPSAIAAAGQIYTDEQGMLDHPTPRAFTTEEVKATVQEFVTAAQNAIEAGFDGVELHGANGYLIEQFLRPTSNTRTDEYGGSVENYARFALEVAEGVSAAIGKEKVGIRLSPYGVFNDMPYSPEYDAIYTYLAEKLNDYVVYVHLVDHASMGAPAVAPEIVAQIRQLYTGTLILSGGYTAQTAEEALESGRADLVAFGRPFIANPDLVERFKAGADLNQPDFSTFYTPGEKGYTDYPVLAEVAEA